MRRLPRWRKASEGCKLAEARSGCRRCQRGPPGGSTWMTSAPWSESMTPASGPAMYWPKSITRIPVSGPAMGRTSPPQSPSPSYGEGEAAVAKGCLASLVWTRRISLRRCVFPCSLFPLFLVPALRALRFWREPAPRVRAPVGVEDFTGLHGEDGREGLVARELLLHRVDELPFAVG